MADLNPAPSDMGLSSPAIGPWFEGSGTLTTLGVPNAELSVNVSIGNDQKWLPPAGGTLSFAIATTSRADSIAHLRQENNEPAFTNNNMVVLFTLLPEVEARLHHLISDIPSPDNQPNPENVATRQRVRYFALEFTISGINDMAQLLSNGFPSDVTTETDRANYLGLKLEGSTIGNDDHSTSDIKQPEVGALLHNQSGTTLDAKMWVFDYRGRPIDPGAVASWYEFLGNGVPWDNLWASTDTAKHNTAARDPQKTIHLVNFHEGALSSTLKARLTANDLTAISGANALWSVSGSNPQFSLTSAPSPDDAPLPRMAFLPHRNFIDLSATSSTVLAGWNDTGAWNSLLNRDYLRVAFGDIEQHLVGLDRNDDDQERSTTRVEALRNTVTTVGLTDSDAIANAIISSYGDTNPTTLVMPVLDTDWSSLTPPDLGTNEMPEELKIDVFAITGAGSSAGDTVTGQSVVFVLSTHIPTLEDDTDAVMPTNASVRVWPKGLDSKTGLHFLMDGGCGRVDSSGTAYVVVPLPDGASVTEAPMGADILIVSSENSRLFADFRFERPALIAGSALSLPAHPDNPGGVTLRVCETSETFTRPGSRLGSGQTLLAISGSAGSEVYQPVDTATLDNNDLDTSALVNQVSSNDTLVLTKPAFSNIPEGNITTSAPNSASTTYHDRNGLLDTITDAGRPVPGMERHEVLMSNPSAETGTVGSTPGRAKLHETPPAQLGHPGLPSAPEVHGVGINLSGPAVKTVEELTRERSASNSIDYLTKAGAPINILDPGGTTTWTATLDTMTFGVAGDAAMRAALAAGATIGPGQNWVDLKNAIQTATGQDIDSILSRGGTFDSDTLARAFDKLVSKTKNGAREAATSILAAIGRAEDFIYVETPAIDNLTASTGSTAVLNAIITRLNERPGLRVMLCVPEKFLPDQPKQLNNIREAAVSDALLALRNAAKDRVCLFTPIAGHGRSLHMSSTVVIIDDIYAVAGTTHLWRRGLTFDSSTCVSLFDENIADSRGSVVASLRRQLIANRLAITVELVTDDALDMVFALNKLNDAGGLGRIDPNAFAAKADTTSTNLKDAWNPDGTPGGVSDWFLFFSSLGGTDGTDFSNATR